MPPTPRFQPSPMRQVAVGSALIAVAVLFVWWGLDALRASGVVPDILGVVMLVCSIPPLLGGLFVFSFGVVDSYRSRRST